jgi:hypothetical protein
MPTAAIIRARNIALVMEASGLLKRHPLGVTRIKMAVFWES